MAQAQQVAGRAVGPEAERADGVLDPVTGGIGHGAMPVDHTADPFLIDMLETDGPIVLAAKRPEPFGTG
ncbi:hypothetical protein [Streptomyces asiaticus]|uniref:hypothetical protein n=1 Tax=Streptomyces asiaticus TaxID=114695 RepID=UPI003812C842